MRQFVLPETWRGGASCELRGREARRIVSVLRLAEGDSFPALGPNGVQYMCTIHAAANDSVVLHTKAQDTAQGAYHPDVRRGRAGGAEPCRQEALPCITLAVGLLKGSKLDDVVRIAVEAGAARVVPLITKNSAPLSSDAKHARLSRIRDEALSQSGSTTRTELSHPVSFADFIRAARAETSHVGLVFHERPLANSSIHLYCSMRADAISLCIGPEGGFDASELALSIEAGFHAVWLGSTVLRAESAAIYALAAVRTICLERSSWKMCSE